MQKFRALLEIMRPLEWSKNFGTMLIALFVASIMFAMPIIWTDFILAGISLSFVVSALYIHNDLNDKEHDSKHPIKKKRPLPSGRLSIKEAQLFGLVISLIAFVISIGVLQNVLLTLFLIAIVINQLAYSAPPLHLKRRPVVDLVSGSLVNTFFRFYSGWVLLIPAFNAPIGVIICVLGMQFGGYTVYRLMSKNHEKKLSYKTSVTLFGERTIKRLALAVAGIGALLFITMCINWFFRFRVDII
jgi:4-hydroxybenzoate polyprenyltransferase